MRLAPPVRTTARNPVLDAALAQQRAADAAAVALCVEAMQPAPDARRSLSQRQCYNAIVVHPIGR